MVIVNTDTILTVINTRGIRQIGHRSQYTTMPHPATDQLIKGWLWDQRYWPADAERKLYSNVPTLWDPQINYSDLHVWQSGYGDNYDLLLLDIELKSISNQDIWAPKIHHGWYYVYNEEYYLFSDSYQAEILPSTTVSGYNSSQLKYWPKPTIPILVQQYQYNQSDGKHSVSSSADKRNELTTSGLDAEFVISSDTDPPLLIAQNLDFPTVGVDLPLVSGYLTNTDLLDEFEYLGYSLGTPNQIFYTDLSPIDTNQPLEIWTYGLDKHFPQQWEVISPWEEFTTSGLQVKFDPDLGIVQFGDWNGTDGTGRIPRLGQNIITRYTGSYHVLYEPRHTPDYLYGLSANTDPARAGTDAGFVQVSMFTNDPASVQLSAILPSLIQENTYQIEIGNNIGRIEATVLDLQNNPVEGQEVFIEILDPIIGSFGQQGTLVSVLTNSEGTGRTVFNAPLTISEVGQATDDIYHSGSDTHLIVNNIIKPGTVDSLYLYKVHSDDSVLGIPVETLSDHYDSYFIDEEITGSTANQTWEESFRDLHSLPKPETYTADELSRGKRTIILTSARDDTINPHTGTRNSSAPYPLTPLYPTSINDIGSVTEPQLHLTYNNISLPIPPSSSTKSYFIVGDTKTNIRAYIIHPRTKNKIYSNIISINIVIPSTINGTFFANVLNDIPEGLLRNVINVDDLASGVISGLYVSGLWVDEYEQEKLFLGGVLYETYDEWFRRTRRADAYGLLSAGIPLTLISVLEADLPAVIPLGFRLKSAGITLASILDQVTYIDPNDFLPSGYYGY